MEIPNPSKKEQVNMKDINKNKKRASRQERRI